MMKSGQEWLKTTFETIDEAVILTDNQNSIQLLSKKAEDLSGWTNNEVLGRSLGDVFQVNDNILICKNGEKRRVRSKSTPVTDNDNLVLGTLFLLNGSLRVKKKLARAQFLSFHDPVTGLYNRRFFEEELKRLNTERNLPISLAVLDVDHLERIKKELGSSKANDIIISIAKIIKDECRNDDIIARVSEKEFVILLPKTASAQAQVLVERLKGMIAKEQLDYLNLSSGEIADIGDLPDISIDGCVLNPLVQIIIDTLIKKNPREKAESELVSYYAMEIGRAARLCEESIAALQVLGLIRNIGEVSLDPQIINKPDTLIDSELAEIRQHPEIGYGIISSISEYADLAESLLSHHERWDGNGYPKGLKGIEIPLEARIVAIADAYNAMISSRPYRTALEPNAAAEEILKNAGTQFDPMLAKLFVNSVLKNKSRRTAK